MSLPINWQLSRQRVAALVGIEHGANKKSEANEANILFSKHWKIVSKIIGWWNKFPYTHIPYLSGQLGRGLFFGWQVRYKYAPCYYCSFGTFPTHVWLIHTARYVIMCCMIDWQVVGGLQKSFPAKSFRVLLTFARVLAGWVVPRDLVWLFWIRWIELVRGRGSLKQNEMKPERESILILEGGGNKTPHNST